MTCCGWEPIDCRGKAYAPGKYPHCLFGKLRIGPVLIRPRIAVLTQENDLDHGADDAYEGNHSKHDEQQEHPAALADSWKPAHRDCKIGNERGQA